MKVEPSGHDHARTTSLESTAGGRRTRRVAEWPAEEPGALLGPVAGGGGHSCADVTPSNTESHQSIDRLRRINSYDRFRRSKSARRQTRPKAAGRRGLAKVGDAA